MTWDDVSHLGALGVGLVLGVAITLQVGRIVVDWLRRDRRDDETTSRSK